MAQEEGPLSGPLTLKDTQSGVVGESGSVWTIAPDFRFTVARQIGARIGPPHRRGRLTAEQQRRLKELLEALGARSPERLGEAPQVNPRRITFSYGGDATVLNLPPGGGQPAGKRARRLVDLVAAIKEMIGG